MKKKRFVSCEEIDNKVMFQFCTPAHFLPDDVPDRDAKSEENLFGINN